MPPQPGSHARRLGPTGARGRRRLGRGRASFGRREPPGWPGPGHSGGPTPPTWAKGSRTVAAIRAKTPLITEDFGSYVRRIFRDHGIRPFWAAVVSVVAGTAECIDPATPP